MPVNNYYIQINRNLRTFTETKRKLLTINQSSAFVFPTTYTFNAPFDDTEIKCHAKYLYAKRTEYLIQENDKVSLLYFH